MNRNDILNSIDTRLTTHYPPDVVDRTLSRISGTLAELDALSPYPEESDFQSQLTTVFYPFLAAAQALDMEGEDCEVLKELINEIVPASV